MTPVPAQRLFFALWPEVPARGRLARLAAEVAHVGQGRAPKAENLHVTVAFLGNVPHERQALARDAGARAAAAVDPFPLVVDRLGGTAYGVAWLAPQDVPAPLRDLREALVQALAASGFAVERHMFRPHVTLARDCVRPAQRGAVAPIGWNVDRLALVASTAAPGGSRYADLASWPLRGVA